MVLKSEKWTEARDKAQPAIFFDCRFTMASQILYDYHAPSVSLPALHDGGCGERASPHGRGFYFI